MRGGALFTIGYVVLVAASGASAYDPRKCWPLANASGLPARCLGPTWDLKPPCPRCWENTLPEYVPGKSATTVGPALRARLTTLLDQYLGLMLAERPASYKDSSGTVFSGIGGRALLLLKLHEVTGNATYLSLAGPYVRAMEAALPGQKILDAAAGFVGFQWSHIGMLCVSALAADRRGDASAAAKRVAEVRDLFVSGAGKYDDFDSGRAGLLYAARFLQANVAPYGSPKINATDVARMASAIVDRGAATGRAAGNAFLSWHGPNDAGLWLGQSHGSAGIIQQLLLAAPDFVDSNATAAALIRATLLNMVDVQFPDGNFPTEYYNNSQDYLVQWDHGAPGVSAALLAGWRAFPGGEEGERFLSAARRALQCTWKRGLIVKGLMNCHGVGGNTWMLLNAGQVTGNQTYMYRALAFQDLVANTPLLSDPSVMRQPQPLPEGPWQFWTGSYESAIELWTDLIYRGVANASETGFMAKL